MKKRVLLIVLGATLFALPLTAQETWVRFYEAEEWEEMSGRCVIQTADGGYAIYAYFYEHGVGEKVWLLMTNPHGDTMWTRKYADTYASWGSDAITECANGSYVLTGYSYGDAWLCRTGANSDVIWERTYGEVELNETGKSVQQTIDGGFIISGRKGDSVWLIKTNTQGDTLWTSTHMEAEEWRHYSGYSVQQTSDKGYIVATGYGLVGYDLGLLKTDSLGQEEWSRIYEDKGNGWCVEQTTDGGFIITANAAVIKTDSVGDVEWTKDFVAECARQTSDGGYILGGIAGTKLIKLNPDGNVLWEKIREFHIYSVRQTADTGYILTGGWNCNLWLVKTDSTGYAPLGIAEPATPPVTPATHADWEVISPVGPQITLRYTDRPQGFTASIFDATGSKVDEIHAPLPSGSITWGEGHQAGVYFIRLVSDEVSSVHKVVLSK